MIFVTWDDVKEFWLWFPRSAGWMMIMLGLLAITWFGYDTKRRGGVIHAKKEEYSQPVDPTKVLRALSYVGLFLGLLIVVAAVVGLIQDIPPSRAYAVQTLGCTSEQFYAGTCTGNNNMTSIALIVLGLVCFLKPVNDVPWASLIGFGTGAVAALALAFLVPVPDVITTWKYWKWVIIGVFLVVSAIVGILWKMATDWLVKLSKLLSWPPIAALVVAFCFIQGILLLQYGVSLYPWPF
ncbi:MAG: hypothetical protein Kow0069_21650 [Promethearchaeota archaeon]